MPRSITTFLMFEGLAEEAMSLYTAVFPGAEMGPVERYGPDEGAAEGAFKRATLTIAGNELMFFDSPIEHNFTFTPSVSLFVECETETELERAFETLVEGGHAMMPLDNYGFSTRFAWISDRFGVSWQLNLE